MIHPTDTRHGPPDDRAPDTQVLQARISQPDAARLYDRLAGIYDLWGHLAESSARRRALELAAVDDGDRVLEVAVGTGLAFAQLARNNPGGRSLGIDISKGMLARARSRLRKTAPESYVLCRASAMAIPAADATFDVLVNNYMFDLLDEATWPSVIGEFRRVLRPGGRLVLADMTLGEKPGSRVYQRLYRRSPGLMGGCRGVRMSATLAGNGFLVQQREYIQQFLFPSEVILATCVG